MRLQKETGSSSLADTVARAIALYEAVAPDINAGKTLMLVDAKARDPMKTAVRIRVL